MAGDDKNGGAQNDSGTSDGTGTGAGTDDAAVGAQNGTQDGATGTGADNAGTGAADKGNADAVSREEFNAVMNRMKAADKRATTAENRLKKIDDGNLSEVEKAKKEAEEAKALAATATVELRNAKIYNAFLAETSFAWHDSGDSFALLGKEGVDIDDSGTVTGMKDAVKALAKNKPHLVKTTQTTEATGSEHNGRRKGETQSDADKSARARRFPAAYPLA